MATLHTNLESNCCGEGEEFSDAYGSIPTGIKPGDLGPNEQPDLWQAMFGNLDDGWWGETSNQWVNPFNTDEQNPRNCINFRNKCRPNDRISLTLADDCCGEVCASVTEKLDILKKYPKVETKEVRVLGPTRMCKNSVSPPISLSDLWQFTITLDSDACDPVDFYRYQVSRNGNSWTTLDGRFVADPVGNNIYAVLFDMDDESCSGMPCLSNFTDPNASESFPNTNAFKGSSAVDGAIQPSCPPRYCYLRIIAIRPVCVASIVATYASAGGLCSSMPVCPNSLEYDSRMCRPLPMRGWAGMPAPTVGGPGHPTYPDRPIPSDGDTDSAQNRKLRSIARQVRKQHPGGVAESERTRNVRALAGPPWNSRATTDGSQGVHLQDGYACSMCNKTFDCVCGVGCKNGEFLPGGVLCSAPSRCRKRFAQKHQSTNRFMDELIACAVSGCRMAPGQGRCTIKQ